MGAEASLSRGSWLHGIQEAERGRYRSQVEINLAQLEMANGDLSGALRRLEDNVEEARASAPEYVSEALNSAGYVHYLDGSFDRSIELLREAEELVKREASPVRLELIRKMLTAAYSKSNQPVAALHCAELVESDPLGLGRFGQ